MSKPNSDKALQPPNYTLYPRLFSAVKNVENALRLLAYDHMTLLQSRNYFSAFPSVLSILSLNHSLEHTPPKHNIGFYLAVSRHLEDCELSISLLRNEEVLQDSLREIYFLIHQAYMELDKADIQPFLVKKTTKNVVFEDYYQSQIS